MFFACFFILSSIVCSGLAKPLGLLPHQKLRFELGMLHYPLHHPLHSYALRALDEHEVALAYKGFQKFSRFFRCAEQMYIGFFHAGLDCRLLHLLGANAPKTKSAENLCRQSAKPRMLLRRMPA